MANETPLESGALRSWALFLMNAWREGKLFEQFELALKLNPNDEKS